MINLSKKLGVMNIFIKNFDENHLIGLGITNRKLEKGNYEFFNSLMYSNLTTMWKILLLFIFYLIYGPKLRSSPAPTLKIE